MSRRVIFSDGAPGRGSERTHGSARYCHKTQTWVLIWFILTMVLFRVREQSTTNAYSLYDSLTYALKLSRQCTLRKRRCTLNDTKLNRNKLFTFKLFLTIQVATLTLFLVAVIPGTTYISLIEILLLQAGDIHPNPGPSSVSDASLNESISSYTKLINSGLSIMHLNIQSIKHKLDILEIEAQAYDILIFTETWITPDMADVDLFILTLTLLFGVIGLTELVAV